MPDWSPNGGKIAYLADTHGISDIVNPSWGDIWVMNPNGSHQHQITHDATYYGTAWSPDGTRIATLDMPTRTIYTINARDGSRVSERFMVRSLDQFVASPQRCSNSCSTPS